jgi:predicted dehydrogenase
LKTQRIAPGEKNSWYIEVLGTQACARYSTKWPKTLQLLEYTGKEQVWQQLEMGHESCFASITGKIFEFGFSDAILQMWAAFLSELAGGEPLKRFASCVRPEETALSHRLFTAALESNREKRVISIQYQ